MKGDYQACLNEIRANKSTLQANAGFNTTASVYEAACLTAIGSTIEAAQLADDLVLPGQGKDIPDYNEKYILAQIYDKAKMHDKAAVLYLECTSYPDIAPLCHNNLAWYFLDKNMLVQSVKQASLAVKHAPDNPSIMDTAAWVSYKSGDTKKSLQIYSKLVKKHFKASYIFNYIKVLKAVGDQKGLNDLVEYALKKTDDLLVRAAILELAGKRGEK
jgi:tetratricopeptide (TPR) repeat protein